MGVALHARDFLRWQQRHVVAWTAIELVGTGEKAVKRHGGGGWSDPSSFGGARWSDPTSSGPGSFLFEIPRHAAELEQQF
jgi:hypothetical protein